MYACIAPHGVAHIQSYNAKELTMLVDLGKVTEETKGDPVVIAEDAGTLTLNRPF